MKTYKIFCIEADSPKLNSYLSYVIKGTQSILSVIFSEVSGIKGLDVASANEWFIWLRFAVFIIEFSGD